MADDVEGPILKAGEELIRIFRYEVQFGTVLGRRNGRETPILLLWPPRTQGPFNGIRNGTKGYLLERALPVLEAWPASVPGHEEEDLLALEEAALAGEAEGFGPAENEARKRPRIAEIDTTQDLDVWEAPRGNKG